MKKRTGKTLNLLAVLALLAIAFQPVQQAAVLPVTGSIDTLSVPRLTSQQNFSSINEFAAAVTNGDGSQLVGIYAEGAFGFRVVQQPSGNAGYVSTSANVVTQFGMASSYGSIGLLAHNYLAGQYFSGLYSGEQLSLVYGDGAVENYTISEIRQYQALTPNSPYSNFINLDNPSTTLSSSDLFSETYGNGGALVLQTCIYKNGNSSWGRLFVIAYKS